MRKQKGYGGFYSWAGLGPTKRPGPRVIAVKRGLQR